MPTNNTEAWNTLQTRLWATSKTLQDAQDAYNLAQTSAQNLVSNAEQALNSAIKDVRTALDEIASTPPGTYPNNIDRPPS
jgi:hypothetical protein